MNCCFKIELNSKNNNFTYIIIFSAFCFTQMGAYHTLDVEQNRKFTITKAKWDSISLERVDTACDPAQVNNLQISKIAFYYNYSFFIAEC